MPYTHVCSHCGKEFISYDRQASYCSRNCYWQAGRVTVQCAGCGQAIVRQKRYVEQVPRVYCSKKCRYAHYSKPSHPITVTCEQCGKSFEKYPGDARLDATHHFCTHTCHLAWQHDGNEPTGPDHPLYNTVTLNCAYCGRELLREAWQAMGYEHQFCSRACYGAWRSENIAGPDHPRWKGGDSPGYRGPNWREQAEQARERDGYRCRQCGLPQEQSARLLDAHHIKPFREFGYLPDENENYREANDLSNLITLCARCHALQHGLSSL